MAQSLTNPRAPHHKVTKPPTGFGPLTSTKSVFLAGSIEMGKAIDWQVALTTHLFTQLPSTPIHVLNPRREDWDNSWKQSKHDANFRGQVTWELEAQDRCNVIAMYFDPATLSPISLLELGIYAHTGKMVVCCPDGYWRKGNVELVCERYGVPLLESVEEFYETVVRKLAADEPTTVTGRE